MSTYTQGEWKAGRLDMRSYDGLTGEPHHYVYRPDDDHKTRICVKGDNCVDDACLIASAPDMYDALKAQAEFDGHCFDCDSCGGGAWCTDGTQLSEKAQNLRRAAIAKAEGREA